MSNLYNFLPPKDQYYTNNSNIPIFNNIGDVNLLDPYIPNYNLTTGDIVPLYVDINNVPTNISGITGPTGSTGGTSGNPPQATPFIMLGYSQVVDMNTNLSGIIQMSLMDENPILGNSSYSFASVNNLMNYNNVSLLYYTINNTNGAIQFYDAKLVQSNPTQPITNYQLYSISYGDYSGNDNTFASWPYSYNQFNSGVYVDYAQNQGAWSSSNSYTREPYQMNTFFQFNEFSGQTGTSSWNPNNPMFKSGKLYHPSYIQMYYADGTSNDNGYTTYSGNGAYNVAGYSPGYPVNINYTYNTITVQDIPKKYQGFDKDQNRYDLVWPQGFSLNQYSMSSENIPTNSNQNFENILNNINTISSNNYLQTPSCNNNNACSNYETINNTYSYFGQNTSTIQAGIAQYLVYQFLPISQIKIPPTNVITDFRNTPYSYTTLPYGVDFTGTALINPLLGPSAGTTGSIPIQIMSMYDGNTGNTGIASSNVIASWMETPYNTNYNCSLISNNISYCGFNNYYDSLMGISYDYGTCGALTINDNPYQKGPCVDINKICVPNYKFLTTYDTFNYPPFYCVDYTKGITTENLLEYQNGVPIQSSQNNLTSNVSYPQYNPTVVSNPEPNYGFKPKGETNYIFLIIAIVVGVILVIFIIYSIYKISRKPRNPYKNLPVY